MRAPAWVGVDVGTSALKVVAFASDGGVVASHEAPLIVDRPDDDRVEADPMAWLTAVRAGLIDVRGQAGSVVVAGLGVTGQMHGTVLVGSDGDPVRPAVLWPDRRAASEREHWDSLPAQVRSLLGGPWSPGMTGPVLGWLARHEPDRLAAAERVLLPKDWVRDRLTGEVGGVTDPSDAAATLLRNVAAEEWSADALGAAGVASVAGDLLPEVVPSDEVVGRWSEDDAVVVTGAGDTPASLLALARCVGGLRSDEVVVNLGTGGQVIGPSAQPPLGDGWPSHHVYSDAAGGLYAMVAVQNAGLALGWVRDRLGLDWADFTRLAQSAPAGAEGVLFAPFLTGERGPLALSRVSEVGWVNGPDRPVELLVRSAVEAQLFLLRRAYELVGVHAGRVLLVGGGARERWLHQLLADCLQVPVHRVELRSAAAAGAALLAASGAGDHLSISAPVTEVEPHTASPLNEAYEQWQVAMYEDR